VKGRQHDGANAGASRANGPSFKGGRRNWNQQELSAHSRSRGRETGVGVLHIAK